MVVHQRRHQEIRQADGAGRAQKQELVVGDFRLEGMVGLFAPAGDLTVSADRINHGTGQDMCTDFLALF